MELNTEGGEMNIFRTVIPTAALAVSLGAAPLATAHAWNGHHSHHGHRNHCSTTAKLLNNACAKDIKDDFWLTMANCSNIADRDERENCRSTADEERQEAKEECRDIYEARREACDLLGEERYNPVVNPAMFVDPTEIGKSIAPNPFFDLTTGYTRVYESGDETITVTVTGETIEIMGVTCIVVRDIVAEDGEVVEDTIDWHAQDIHGNVWYFGEIVENYQDGLLNNLDGSFKAGDNFALPGIIMYANPMEGDAYREEWALAEAEDIAEVVSATASESTSAVSCDGTCLQTKNYTPLEPGVVEYKFYAPGIGFIVEVKPGEDGEPDERGEIVDFYHAM